MLDVGALVRIIGSDGRGPVPNAPPAMVIRRYDGFPSNGVHGSGEMIVYDILFMGKIEYAISGEWLAEIEENQVS